MKRCPQCNHSFTDETLNFCLYDGTLLLKARAPEATVFRPSNAQAFPPAETKGSRINISYIVILVLAVLLTGSAVALFYQREKTGPDADAGQTGPNTQISNASASVPGHADSPTPSASQNTALKSRFSKTSCNSIRDSRTGLEWYVGPDRNVTWNEAQEWTLGLGACSGGWRMPAIDEIAALYDPGSKAGTGYFTGGKYFPAHIDPVFEAIGGGSWVWANSRSGGDAESFNLNQGKPVRFSEMNTVYSTRAFAVRTAKD